MGARKCRYCTAAPYGPENTVKDQQRILLELSIENALISGDSGSDHEEESEQKQEKEIEADGGECGDLMHKNPCWYQWAGLGLFFILGIIIFAGGGGDGIVPLIIVEGLLGWFLFF